MTSLSMGSLLLLLLSRKRNLDKSQRGALQRGPILKIRTSQDTGTPSVMVSYLIL